VNLPLEYPSDTDGGRRIMAPVKFDPTLYDVLPITFKEAKRLIIEGHYTHSLTKGRHCFGMFRGVTRMRAAVFGQPSGRGVAKSFMEDGDERNTLELLRLYITDTTGKNAESWFLAKTIRLLPREVKIVVAYSSPGAGHYGACYQASNFLYLGRSRSGQPYHYVDRNGMFVNKRVPWQFGPRSGRPWINEATAAKHLKLTKVKDGQKYVYAYLRKRRGITLKRPILAYPKPGVMEMTEVESG
jgi:hypothetical protein